jgi:hypothetical protein
MADTRPSPVSFAKKVRLCLYGMFSRGKLAKAIRLYLCVIFSPGKLAAEDAANNFKLVSQAFWRSLRVVFVAGACGFGAAWLAAMEGLTASRDLVSVIQAVGALLLLWGTLSVCGWEIQLWNVGGLAQGVNRRLCRALYFVGTLILVFSMFVTTSKP